MKWHACDMLHSDMCTKKHAIFSLIHESGHWKLQSSTWGGALKQQSPVPKRKQSQEKKKSKANYTQVWANKSKHQANRTFICKSRTLTLFGSKQLSASLPDIHTAHTWLLACDKWQVPRDLLFCFVEHWRYRVFRYHVYRLQWLGT